MHLETYPQYGTGSFYVSVYESRTICMSHELWRYASRNVSTIWYRERWGAGVETQKNVRGEIGGWGRVPFNETYAPSLSTIYDGA